MIFGIDELSTDLWRDPRVQALRPRCVRIRLNWPRVQGDRGLPILWPANQLKVAQELNLGVVLSVYGMNPWWPNWAQNPRDYRSFLAQAVNDVVVSGARLMAVSPWNEPNHSAFNPHQRQGKRPISPGWYARIIWPAAKSVALPAGAVLLAGDLAGGAATLANQSRIGIPEFLDHVGSDVLSHPHWAVHDYTPSTKRKSSTDELLDALKSHGHHPVGTWVTEAGALRSHMTGTEAAAIYKAQIVRWKRLGVYAFIQYELEDNAGWPSGVFNGQQELPSYAVLRDRPQA